MVLDQFDNTRAVDLIYLRTVSTVGGEPGPDYDISNRFIEVLIINDSGISDDILQSDQLLCFCLRHDREDRWGGGGDNTNIVCVKQCFLV